MSKSATEQRQYWIIINPKQNKVWARNGVHFWSYEDAKTELDAQVAKHGGNSGWEVEEHECWVKNDKDEDW